MKWSWSKILTVWFSGSGANHIDPPIDVDDLHLAWAATKEPVHSGFFGRSPKQ
jgi:hypothetical protein